MSIHHGRTVGAKSSFADGPGSPEAVVHFREVLARQQEEKMRLALAQKLNGRHKTAVPKEIETMLEVGTQAADGSAVEIIDVSASREFQAARLGLPDPAPVVIVDPVGDGETQPAPRKPHNRSLSDAQIRAVHADWLKSGDKLEAVCLRWNFSKSALSSRFRKLGLSPPGKTAVAKTRKKALATKTAETAVSLVPAAPVAPVTAVSPSRAYDPNGFLPSDLLAQVRAFRDEMAAAGIDVAVKFDLRFVKEVQL